MLNPSQLEDFNTAILQAGFEVDDIDTVAVEDDPTAMEQYIPRGIVTVHRKSTDVSEKYRAGSGLAWQQDFEADLKAGKFGQP